MKDLWVEKYRPKIILIEFIKPDIKEFYQHNIKDIEKSKIYKFMISKKYKLVNWIHDDLVYVPNK